jgi:hypothetical protein
MPLQATSPPGTEQLGVGRPYLFYKIGIHVTHDVYAIALLRQRGSQHIRIVIAQVVLEARQQRVVTPYGGTLNPTDGELTTRSKLKHRGRATRNATSQHLLGAWATDLPRTPTHQSLHPCGIEVWVTVRAPLLIYAVMNRVETQGYVSKC